MNLVGRHLRNRFPLGEFLLTVVLLAIAALVGAASTAQPIQEPAAGQRPLPVEKIEFEPGHHVPSAVCGKCHVDIYEIWEDSVHAQSFVDPIFQAGLAQAIVLEGPTVAETCLTCHAPATTMMEPPVPTGTRVREGVGCHFCHTIRGADLDRFPAFELDRNLVMYGPFADAESPVHETQRSEFLLSAQYCATCHEYTTPAGLNVLSTFTEFEGASHAQVLACQDCHMPLVVGQLVAPPVAETARLGLVDSHAIPGGRSLWQVRRAVDVQIVTLAEHDGSVDVRVAVENRGAGHWIPTGMPSKRIVLEVSTSWDDSQRVERFVFGRRVVDAEGRLLSGVAETMLFGASLVGDTRLRPGQRREFGFTLPAPMNAGARLVVRLYYESTESPTLQAPIDDIVRIERQL